MTASSSTYNLNHSTYDTTKEETQEVPHSDEEDIDEPEDEKLKVAETSVRREEVWRDLFLTSSGRDKAFVRHSYPRTRMLPSISSVAPETDTIFHTPVSSLPRISIY